MKIAFVTPGMTFGGAERVISILANNWCDMGHDVSMFITGTNKSPVYELDKRINVEYYADFNEESVSHVKLVAAIRHFVLKESPDSVISFMNDVCAYTIVALIGTGIPVIYSERNDPNKTNQGKVEKICRKIIEIGAKHVVFQTSGARNCYSKKVQKKSSILLNPVNLEKIPFRNEEAIDFSQIVSVARLEPQKNQDLLIEAFNLVSKKHKNVILKIFGEGSLQGSLEKKIGELGLQDRVFLMGAKTDVLEWIKDTFCFVLSSDYEGLPNSLIEAMCMGMPCISTDCSPGGARELLGNKRGVIVPCGDKVQLADAINTFLEKPSSALKCGENAYALRNEIECKVIAKKWLKLIETIKK